FLFVPLTTAALSRVERHQMAGAAGGNAVVRQIGASIGLFGVAALFTRYSTEAAAGIVPSITALRPEIAAQFMAAKTSLLARGFAPDVAQYLATKTFAGRAALQGTVIGFDKTFILQTIAFLGVMP